MKQFLIFFSLLLISSPLFGQQKPAYRIYNSKGKKVSYKKMLKKMAKDDIVFFGELHNNAISHWLQYELTSDFISMGPVILGAEMFEADNQDPLNDYLSGEIDYKGLDTLARLWSNYKTDYAPLVDLAKENNLSFIATNIPRRYANMVYKKGFEILDELSDEEKSWMAPLPMPFDPDIPSYQNILTMMGDHGTPGIVKAQATKDATMAHFIIQNFEQDKKFIHYNGAYHSDDYEGILWYINLSRPDINCGTITTVSQANIKKLSKEYLGKADFIICVDENMTNTY